MAANTLYKDDVKECEQALKLPKANVCFIRPVSSGIAVYHYWANKGNATQRVTGQHDISETILA